MAPVPTLFSFDVSLLPPEVDFVCSLIFPVPLFSESVFPLLPVRLAAPPCAGV
jgi:hypothetical protein